MTKNKKIYYHNGFLIEQDKLMRKTIYLKHFSNILKQIDRDNQFSYAFSNGIYTLHNNLSVKENLVLDVLPSNFNSNDNDDLRAFLNIQDNPNLTKMVRLMGNLNKKVTELEKEQIQVFSILKAIFANKKYILLNYPDYNLSKLTLELVKAAIEVEINIKKRSVIINSKQPFYWFDIMDKLIHFNDTKIEIIDLNEKRGLEDKSKQETVNSAA